MTEEEKTNTVPMKISFIKTEKGFIGGNKQSCEILEALPENVDITLEFAEEDADGSKCNIDIAGATMGPQSIDDYEKVRAKISEIIGNKTDISEKYLETLLAYNGSGCNELSFFLRGHLAVLRKAEQKKKKELSTKAPVLEEKLLSRSEISLIAYEMIALILERAGYDSLGNLVGVLLDIDLSESRLLKNINKRENAKWILAQRPEYSTRQVAAEIGVNHTTVSRWLKDPEYMEVIASLREMLELKRQGKSVFSTKNNQKY